MISKCEIEDCENTIVIARGWCRKHYGRWHSRGDVNARVKERTKLERDTPEYRAWKSMKTRCYNKNVAQNKTYHAKGVKVCERWMHSYYDFLSDVGRRPGNNYSLDRIDNDGNYEPKNVKWSTKNEQMVNQGIKSSNTSGYRNVHITKNGKWACSLARDKEKIYLGVYDNILDAVKVRDAYLAKIKMRNS